MIKDEISDNNNQCENVESITEEKVRDDYVECVSEDSLCDVGGGGSILEEINKKLAADLENRINPEAVCPAKPLTRVSMVKYGAPNTFANKKSDDLAEAQKIKEK